MIVDKDLEIKRDVIHGFQITDDNIRDLWGPVIWVYKTFCKKYGKQEDKIKEWVGKGANNIFKFNKMFMTLNPAKVTCPVCLKNMSEEIKKIPAEVYEILLKGYNDDGIYMSKLKTEQMGRDISSRMFSMFKCSGGYSLAWLEDFTFEKHKGTIVGTVIKLKKIRDEFTKESKKIKRRLNEQIKLYEAYLKELEALED